MSFAFNGVFRGAELLEDPWGEQVFQVGEWRARASLNELVLGNRTVHLEPRVMQCLVCLAEQPGRVVSKSELLDRVWPDTFVSESVLWQCVWKLRQVFGDASRSPRYIQTVPKIGYRLVAPVDWAKTPLPELTPRRCISLAVLRVADESPSKALGFLCQGIFDGLRSSLSRARGLRIVTGASPVRQAEGGELERKGGCLRAEMVLKGRVSALGSRVHMMFELVEAATGTQHWSRYYEERIENVLTVPRRVARAIAERLNLLDGLQVVSTGGNELRVSEEVLTHYLKGRYHFEKNSPENFELALNHFEQAIVLDPGCAKAYAGVADCYAVRGVMSLDWPRDACLRARAAAKKALLLDDSLAPAHATLATIALHFEFDLDAGTGYAKRAIDLDPSWCFGVQWYVLCLLLHGRLDESLEWCRRLLSLDPLRGGGYLTQAWVHYLSRDYEQCVALISALEELDPYSPHGPFMLALAYSAMGKSSEAIRAAEREGAILGEIPLVKSLLARGLALAGDTRTARELLEGLRDYSGPVYPGPYHIAGACAALGDSDLVFEFLNRGFEDRTSFMMYLGLDPIFDSVRRDPRYGALLRRLKLDR